MTASALTWGQRLAKDPHLRKAVSSVGGNSRSRGIIFSDESSWSGAARTIAGELVVGRGEAPPPSLLARLPIIGGTARLVRQLSLADAAATALGLRHPSSRKPHAPVSIAAGILSYLFGVGILVSTMALIEGLATSIASPLGQSAPVLAIPFGAFLVWAFFAAFVAALSIFPRVRETWSHHAAEHKVIGALHAAGPDWRDACHRMPKEHVRCGTDFAFLLLGSFVVIDGIAALIWPLPATRAVFWLVGVLVLDWLVLKAIAQDRIAMIVSKPGLWLQRITTREPEARHMDLAIAGAAPLFDRILGSEARGEA